ncbi:reverse transcriptase domain-containing protein [Tanacetum coccineum]
MEPDLKGDDMRPTSTYFHERSLMCPEFGPLLRTRKSRSSSKVFLKGLRETSLHPNPPLCMMHLTWHEIGGPISAGNLPTRGMKPPKFMRLLLLAPLIAKDIQVPTRIVTNELHHGGACAKMCARCRKRGHEEKDCRVRMVDGRPQEVECWGCGGKGHTRNPWSQVGWEVQKNQARVGVPSGGKCCSGPKSLLTVTYLP